MRLASQHLGSIPGGAKEEESPNTSFEESQQLKAELGFPWLLAYLPIKSCHVTLKAEAGTFSPPTLSRIPYNNWCNWTIWAGPHKHILIYIDGFEGKMRLQLVKPSVDDSRAGSATPSGNLTKTLGLELNSMQNEELTLMNKPAVLPTSPHVSQKFRKTTKLAAVKDHGIATKSANFPEDIRLTTHWKPVHMRHTGRSVFESSAFKGSITSPQNSMEEQTAPIQSPKDIPVKKQGYILESLQSNTELSRKLVDVMETQQSLKLKEAPTIKEMDNHAHGEQNGNSDQYMVTTNMGKNEFHGSKLFTQMSKYTIKTKSHLTTLGYRNVLPGPPLRAPDTNLVDTPTTLNPEVVLSKMDSAFRSHENYFILEYKPNPGDLLFEITFGIEHKGQIPPIGSDQEKALIDSVKNQVQEKVRHFAGKVKEVRLKGIVKRKGTEMDRQNGPNLLFVFWLHLTLEEKNISQLLPSQLENISGAPAGTGEVQTVLVKDVNECSSGIGVCGKEAICVNGYGTYTCQCKQDYEDHSLTKSGTLCIRNPRSGFGSLYSYTEILVGTAVFFISALVVLISVLCTIVRKRRSKKDVHFQEAATPGTPAVSRLQPTTFVSNNISPLLTLDPAQLKLRAKLPEWPLQLRSSPSETYTVSVEQSENL
ncbi:Transmembrane matrix receptor MUP-4, partial [Varanus komodoensis]